jgi:hypothetical protein
MASKGKITFWGLLVALLAWVLWMWKTVQQENN